MAGARTPLFSRKNPGGVYTVEDASRTTGSLFWVDSTTGSDTANDGSNPDSPLATWDAAVNKCTASKGDIIFLMPGHAENITTATGVNFDTAGITTIGLGEGNLIPTISFTLLAGSVTIGAANITLRNIRFVANVTDGVTTGLTIAAAGDGCTLDGLQFRDTSATKEFLKHISVATTVTDLTIKNCSFVGAAGTMSGSVVFAGSSTNCLLENNYWYVDSSDSVVDHQTTAAVNLVLRDNCIINVDSDAAGYCIEAKTASTGAAYRNFFGYGKTDAEVSLGDAMWWFENYASNTIAESGLLDPATTHEIP